MFLDNFCFKMFQKKTSFNKVLLTKKKYAIHKKFNKGKKRGGSDQMSITKIEHTKHTKIKHTKASKGEKKNRVHWINQLPIFLTTVLFVFFSPIVFPTHLPCYGWEQRFVHFFQKKATHEGKTVINKKRYEISFPLFRISTSFFFLLFFLCVCSHRGGPLYCASGGDAGCCCCCCCGFKGLLCIA